ncbi:MAG: amidohydrolase family protein [Candidatus Sabulitectum sp.]|nr:amidohydrolase family protein [Candidatus Sabulitectum sp.]
MPTIRCRSLWTGTGSCLSHVAVHIDDCGMITTIEKCHSAVFDYNFAMPSFVDAHVHCTWMVAKEASLDLSRVRSSDEFLSLVHSAVVCAGHRIVRGESFDESDWTNSDLPTLSQLDSVTGNVPVFLRRVCGHAALVNSAMLRLMVMVMDPDMSGVNKSTGVLKEWPVLNFEKMFPLPDEVLVDAASRVQSMIYSKGVTAVRTFESVHNTESVQDLYPGLDVSVTVIVDNFEELPALDFPLKVVKLFLDGAFGAGNAALLHPYADGSVGDLHYTDEELLALFVRCGKTGHSVAAHAIGGEALRQLDRVSNEAFRLLGNGFNVRIEHAEDLLSAWPGTWNPEYHIFSMQPNFVERWQRPEGMYDRILPLEQSFLLNPFRTVLDAGFRLGFGSDCMPLDPLYGLRGAVQHRNSSESLSMEEALYAYTLDAAFISGLSQLAIPLGRGRTADMVFLSGTPFEGLEGITVEATMKNGNIVFENNVSVEGI